MIKIILGILALVVISIGGYVWFGSRGEVVTQTVPESSRFTETATANRYTNSVYGFSASYPRDWQYQEVEKSSESSRGRLRSMVIFSPDGTLTDQSVTVAISEARSQATPANAIPTTIGGRTAVYYEDTAGERTYVVSTDRYQYSLLMGSAATVDVRAAFDTLVQSFALE